VDRPRRLRSLGEVELERGLRYRLGHDLGGGDDRGRPWLVVQRGQFADQVTGDPHGEQDRPAVRRVAENLGTAVEVLADTARAATTPGNVSGATRQTRPSASACTSAYVATWRKQALQPAHGSAPAASRSAVGAPFAAAAALVCIAWSPIWCPA
jgi:hypothetical protein